MHCVQCREEIRDDADLCPKCGTSSTRPPPEPAEAGPPADKPGPSTDNVPPEPEPGFPKPCVNCNFLPPEHGDYCEKCGMALRRTCPECGHEGFMHEKVCRGCSTLIRAYVCVLGCAKVMRVYRSQEQWQGVLRAQNRLPKGIGLPGENGQKLLAQIEEMRGEAVAVLCSQLAQAIEDELAYQRYERVWELIGQYREMDPDNEQIKGLASDMETRLQEVGLEYAVRKAERMEKKGCFAESVSLFEAYLNRHPRSAHADKAQQRISVLRRAAQCLEEVKQANFAHARLMIRDMPDPEDNTQIIQHLERECEGKQAAFDQAMAECDAASEGQDLVTARLSLEKALQACPEAAPVKTKLMGLRSKALALLEKTKADIGAAKFDAAAEKIAQAKGLYPDIQGLADLEGLLCETLQDYEHHMGQAEALAEERKPGEALEACSKAMEWCPNSDPALVLHARISRRMLQQEILESLSHHWREGRGLIWPYILVLVVLVNAHYWNRAAAAPQGMNREIMAMVALVSVVFAVVVFLSGAAAENVLHARFKAGAYLGGWFCVVGSFVIAFFRFF